MSQLEGLAWPYIFLSLCLFSHFCMLRLQKTLGYCESAIDFFLIMYSFLLKVLVQTIEHELEVTIGVHEVRSEYERQMKE